MTKTKKNIIQKNAEIHKNQRIDEKSDKQRQDQEWANLMNSKEKKLSEGAQNIALTHRIRGNRGTNTNEANSKGHHKEGHAIHKGPHKKK